MKKAALALYARGQELLQAKGMILVDTKYEFGLDTEGNLVLIDEIHTPDSSRFWYLKDYENKEIKFPDKEFLREWLRGNGYVGEGPIPVIPADIRSKVFEGYKEVYEMITGAPLDADARVPSKRVIENLKEAKQIKGVFALIIAGSESDRPHIDKIVDGLNKHQIPATVVIASAHKQPKVVMDLIDQYNESIEPLVCITIAGRSNALSGVVASNLRWPVIACPPFKDYSDYLTNIHSSLQMPSNTPAMTVVDPGNAALATALILKSMEMAR
jgi:phosphoribosylaminoimidazole carboxylase PurE protein